MVAVQFTSVGDVNIDIQNLIIGGLSVGDTLNIFDGGVYSSYMYDTATYIYDPAFEDDGGSDWIDQGPGWSDRDAWRAVGSVAPGSGYWFLSPTSKTITSGGEVIAANAPLNNVGNNVLRMISNPMPVSVDLQDIVFDGIPVGATVNFFNGVGYSTYVYDAATYIYDPAFEDDGGSDWVDQGPGWSDMNAWRAEKTINVGEAFWINSSANVTVTFPNPK